MGINISEYSEEQKYNHQRQIQRVKMTRIFQIKNLLFVCYFIFLSGFCETIISSESMVFKKKAFSALFPGGNFFSSDNFFGTHGDYLFQYIPSLRGRQGFINLNDAKMIRIEDSTVIVAFSVFLCEKSVSIDSLISNPLLENPPKSLKLLQLVFVKNSSDQLISKPSDFPIVSKQWTCLGDVCDQVTLEDFRVIDKEFATFRLSYSKGISSQYFQIFSFANDSLKYSKPILYGNLSGESGCTITRDIDGFSFEDGKMFVKFNTECDLSCSDFCLDMDIQPGRKTESKTLFMYGIKE
jgi:hypothetical protein